MCFRAVPAKENMLSMKEGILESMEGEMKSLWKGPATAERTKGVLAGS